MFNMNKNFDLMSRIGNDDAVNTQNNILNKGIENYMTFNPFENKCLGGTDESTRQSNVFINKSTLGMGPLGCNVDDSSLLSKGKLTNDSVNKLNLRTRTYLTVPYLGRGSVSIDEEDRLRLGDSFRDKKSKILMEEQCQNNISKYPMNKGLKHKLEGCKNTSNKIGVDTRNIYKTDTYSQN